MFTTKIISNTLRTYKSHSVISKLNLIKTFQPCNRFQTVLFVDHTNIRFCSTLTRKTYYETENNYVFQVINSAPLVDSVLLESPEQKIINMSMFTSYLNKDWRNSNATDIVKAFRTVKQFCVEQDISFSDPRFDSLVDGLMDHCDKLTDEELLVLLKCLSEYPFCAAFTSHNYHDLWSCLDDICCWRMSSWDIDQQFAFADAWFKLKLGKLADFIFELLNRLVKRADKLTKDQLVHIFFYFNICRKRPVDFEYEHAVQQKIGEMNIDEMAVVALGYFKTKSKIKLLPIMETMTEEVTNKAMGIHEISLTAILKALRLSVPFKILPNITRMFDSLYPELDRFSELACLHVALLATGLQTFHGNILRKCSQKLVENLPNARLKDIERILNVLTMFTFDPNTKPDIFELALQEIQKDSRIAEMNQYPKSFVAALHYLSLRGIYSYNLMDRVLNHEFITIHFGKSPKMLPQQLFSLDACITIECPNYTGNRLPSQLKYKAAKWLTEWAPSYDQYKKINAKDQMFLDTVDAVKKIVGNEEFLLVDHVLPHFPKADIIVCKDFKTGAFVKPVGFDQYVLGDVMKPFFNNGNLKWYSIMVLGWTNTFKDESVPLGLFAMKQRQLQKIGYTPVTVLWNQFAQVSPKEKQQYILNKLV